MGKLLELLESDSHAPTRVRKPEQALKDHLADSLVALELDGVSDARGIADVGAGAGFPGLPLALALPEAEVVLVDSNARKTAFIERAIQACEIGNALAVHARAEAWPAGVGRFDLVTVRAVASLDVLAEYASPLLRVGGMLAAWRGQRDPDAEAAGRRAADILGLEVGDVVPVVPYPGARHRHIHLMRKVGETPDRYPRRPGMASKRPLGSAHVSSDRAQR